MSDYLTKKVKHIATYGKAFPAEAKLEADEWPRLLPIVINKYNYDTISTVHGLTPYDATKDINQVKVWLSIYNKSRDTRMYEKYKSETKFVLC